MARQNGRSVSRHVPLIMYFLVKYFISPATNNLTFIHSIQSSHKNTVKTQKFNYFNVKSRWLREKNKTWSSCPWIMRIYGYFDAIKCKVWPDRPSQEERLRTSFANYVSSSGEFSTITSTKVVLRNMFCIKLKSPHQHAKTTTSTNFHSFNAFYFGNKQVPVLLKSDNSV